MKSVLIQLSVLFACSLSAAVKYVDCNATGANNGTSWTDAWQNIPSISGVSGGDTVWISGGTYLFRNFHFPNGTSGNPIIYQASGEAGHNTNVIFDGTSGSGNYCVLSSGDGYFTLSGNVGGTTHLFITNYVYPYPVVNCDGQTGLKFEYVDFYGPVRLHSNTNMELSHCHIKMPTGDSTYDNLLGLYSAGATTWDSLFIHDCLFEAASLQTSDQYGDDIIQWGSGFTISNCVFQSYASADRNTHQNQDGIQWGDFGASYCKVIGNTFLNLGNTAIYINLYPRDTSQRNVHDIIIANNVCAITAPGMTGLHRPFEIGFQNGGGGLVTNLYNILIANNTFIDFTAFSAINMGASSPDPTVSSFLIANNMIYNCGLVGQKNAIECAMSNNVVIATNMISQGPSGVTIVNPAIDIATTTWGATNAFISYSERSAANNLRLRGDPIAVDKGLNLSGYFTTDRDGNTRSGSWDIGAYEYVPPSTSARWLPFFIGTKP